MDRNGLFSVNARAVVCDHYKHRVGPKWFLSRSTEKLAQSVIRILDGIFAFSLFGILLNPAFGISVRLVVGYGQNGGKEWVSSFRNFAAFIYGARKQVLV